MAAWSRPGAVEPTASTARLMPPARAVRVGVGVGGFRAHAVLPHRHHGGPDVGASIGSRQAHRRLALHVMLGRIVKEQAAAGGAGRRGAGRWAGAGGAVGASRGRPIDGSACWPAELSGPLAAGTGWQPRATAQAGSRSQTAARTAAASQPALERPAPGGRRSAPGHEGLLHPRLLGQGEGVAVGGGVGHARSKIALVQHRGQAAAAAAARAPAAQVHLCRQQPRAVPAGVAGHVDVVVVSLGVCPVPAAVLALNPAVAWGAAQLSTRAPRPGGRATS